MNQFENHELVKEIYEIMRDHNVLTEETPFALLDTTQRVFLEKIDAACSGHIAEAAAEAHEEGYRIGRRLGAKEMKEAAEKAVGALV